MPRFIYGCAPASIGILADSCARRMPAETPALLKASYFSIRFQNVGVRQDAFEDLRIYATDPRQDWPIRQNLQCVRCERILLFVEGAHHDACDGEENHEKHGADYQD
jgi:hypothetical protein